MEAGGGPPPSPLTGCYLLIVIAEPRSQEDKDIILQRLAKGLLSWDASDCLVDLEKELAIITEQALEGEESRYGERLIQFASENLVTEILIHPSVSTLIQCVRNLLSSFTRHRHIIHSGYTFAGNGSWIVQDGTFSYQDLAEAFQEVEVQRVLHAYDQGISMDVHCAAEGEWTRLPKETFSRCCKLRLNPNDVLTTGTPAIVSFLAYLAPFLQPAELNSLLQSSDVVGNIRFSRPTLYVFPGGQGDAALFGINGFNMLVDGGFSRKACFWDFVRHLDRLDAVLLTRLNNSNVNGISAVLRRKKENALYPQVGHFFCNIPERKSIPSPDGDKDRDPLLVNLLDEGQEIVSNLRHLNLSPQLCYRDSEPINLYHKVGHGTLDMYVLSPAKESKEVREFLQKWNSNDQKLFSNPRSVKEFIVPIQNIISICALLVWQPASPDDTITRILFPGSAPQSKIFEGLDRLRQLDCIKHPVCTEKSLTPVSIIKTKQKESIIDKIIPSDKQIKLPDNRREKAKAVEHKLSESIERNGVPNGVHPDQIISDKIVKKSDSTESERSTSKHMESKKIEEKLTESKEKSDKPKSKPKFESRAAKQRTESQQRKKPIEKKASPTTPKKSVEIKMNGDVKPKQTTTAAPPKSTKDANNRKVLESKKTAPKREPQKPAHERKETKVERKPISSRPKEPLKAIGSPIKRLINGVHKPESISRRGGKLDKEGTTDSSTVSTPSADPENLLKKDISKLTDEEIHQMKAQELAELKEEQEAVREIEAVFQKSEKTKEPTKEDLPESRQVKDTSTEEKVEEQEEYLIVEKVEIERDSLDEQDTKEDEILKLARDSEESEKQRKPSQVEIETEAKVEDAKVEKTETVGESQPTRTTTTSSTVSHIKPEESVKSPDEKLDSTDKKTEEKHIEDDVKEVQESQPEEKVSGTFESGATTTAPTLPEDERITLDEIKEDIGDPGVEEKHVKEETKEKDIPQIQLPPKTFEPVCKLPPVVGIRLEKHTHIRDIVKTPDEVADLPVHEEVDIENYQSYENKEGTSEKSKDKEAPANEGAIIEKETKDQQVVAGLKETKVEELPQIPDNEAIEKLVESTNIIEATSAVIKEKELSKSPDEEKEKDEGEQKEIETVEVDRKISETSTKKDDSKVNEEDKSADKALKYDTTAKQDEQGEPEPEEVKSRKESIATDLDVLRKASIVSTEGKPGEDQDISETEKEAAVEKPVSRKQSTVQDHDLSPSKSRKSSIVEIEKPQLEDNEEHVPDKSKKLSLDGVTEKSTPDTEILKDYVIIDKTDYKLESLESGKIEETEIEETTQKTAKVADLTIQLDKVSDDLEAVEVSESTNVEAPFEKLEAKDKSPTKQEPTSEKPDTETHGHQRERRKSSLGIESVSIHASPERIIDSRRSSIATDKVTSRKSSLVDDFGRLSPTDMHRRVSSPRFDEEGDHTKLEAVIEDVDNKVDEKSDSPTTVDQDKKVIMGDKIEVMITERIEEEANEEVVNILGKETIIIGHKVEEPEKAETVIIPDSPLVEDKLSSEFIEKMELGRKSPKEREQDVIKIVASVAEVLKSDAPLEEFKGKIPFVVPGFTSYTEELRETHITTVDSPTTEQLKDISSEEKVPEDVRAKSPLASFLDQEREYSSRHIESENEATAAELEDAGVVHRMLVTTSSEDGGEEIEICPPGSIIFSKSSESSGRSTPEPQSQKLSQRSSLVDTTSESLPTVKQAKVTTDGVSSTQEKSDVTTATITTDTTSSESLKEEIERVVEAAGTPPKVIMDVIKETSPEIGKSDAVPKDDDLKATDTLIKRDISNDLTVSGSSDKRDSGKVSPELRDVTPDPPRPSGSSTPETEQKDSGRTSPEVLSTSGKSSPDVDSYKKRSLEGVQHFVEEPIKKVSVGGVDATALDHLGVAHSPEKKLSISDVEINLKDVDDKAIQRKPSSGDVEKELEAQIIPHESFKKELETTKTVTTKSETVPDKIVPKMTETAADISEKGSPKSITDKLSDVCSGVEEICEKKIISIGGKADSLLGGIMKIKDDVVGKLQEQTESAAEEIKSKSVEFETEIQESAEKVDKDLVDIKRDIKDDLENIVEKTTMQIDDKKDSISTVEESLFSVKEKASEVIETLEDKASKICDKIEDKAAETKDGVEKAVSKVEASLSTAASAVEENVVEIKDELKEKTDKVGEDIETKLTGAKEAIGDAGSKVEESLSAAAATIKDKVTEIKDGIKEQTEKISDQTEETKKVVKDAASHIEDKAGDIKEELKDNVNKIGEKIEEKTIEVKEEVNDIHMKVEDSLTAAAAATEDKMVEIKEKTDKINEQFEEKVTEVKDTISKVKDSVASTADTIEDKTTTLKEDIKEKIDHTGDQIEENITKVKVELQEAASKAEESLSSTATTLKETVAGAKEDIVEKATKTKEKVQEATSKLEESLSTVASNIEDKLTDIKDASASKIDDSGSSVIAAAEKVVTETKDNKEIVEGIDDQIDEKATEIKVKDTVSKAEDDLSSAVSTLEDKVTEAKGAIKEKTENIVEHVEANLTDVKQEVEEAVSKVGDSVIDVGEQIQEKGGEVENEVEEICTKAEASLISATSTVIEKVTVMKDEIKDKTNEMGAQIGNKLTQAKKDAEDEVAKIEDSVPSAVSTLENKVSDITEDFKEKTETIDEHIERKAEEVEVELEEIATKAEAILSSAAPTIKDKVTDIKDDIKQNTEEISEKVGEKAAEVKEGIKDSVSNIEDPLPSAASPTQEKVSDTENIVKETTDTIGVKMEDKITEVKGTVEEVCTKVNASLSLLASSVKDEVADITDDTKKTTETFGKETEEKATEAKEDVKGADSKIEESHSSASTIVDEKLSELKTDVKEKTEKIGDDIEEKSVEVKDKVEEIQTKVDASLSSAASTVIDKVADFKDDVKEEITESAHKVEENASQTKEGVKDALAKVEDSISSASTIVVDVSDIKDDAKEKAEKIDEHIEEKVAKPKDGVEEMYIKADSSLTSAVSTVKDKVTDIKDDVKEKTNEIGGKIEEKASEGKEHVKDVVTNIESTLSTAASVVENNLSDIKDDLKEKAEKLGERIDEKSADAKEGIEEVCTKAGVSLSSAASTIQDKVADLHDDIKEKTDEISEQIGEKATEAKKGVKDAVAKVEDSLSSAASTIEEKEKGIKDDLKEKAEKISERIDEKATEAKEGIEEVCTKADVFLASAASTIQDKAADLHDDIKEKTDDIGEQIGEKATEAKKGVKDAVVKVEDSLSSAASTIEEKGKDIKDDLKEKAEKIGERVDEKATDVKEGVEEVCTKADVFLSSAASTIQDKAADFHDDIKEKTDDIGEQIGEKATEAKKGVKDAVAKVEDSLSSAASTIEEKAKDIKDDLKEKAEKIGERIDEKATDAKEGVEEVCTKADVFLASAASTIQDKAADLHDDIKEKTDDIGEQIGEKATEAKKGVKDAVAKVEDSLSSSASTIEEKVSDIKEDVKATTEKIGDCIEEKAADVKEGVEASLSEAASTVKDTMTHINDGIKEKTVEISENVEDIAIKTKENMKDVVSTVEDTLKSTKSALEEKTLAVSDSVKEKTDKLSEKIEEAKEKVQYKTSKIEDSVSTAATSIKDTVTGIKDTTIESIDKVNEHVEEKASEAKQGVQEAVSEVEDSLSTIKGEIKDRAEETKMEIVDEVQSKIEAASTLKEDTKEEIHKTVQEIEEKKDSFLGGIANSFNDLRSRVFGSSEKSETIKPEESPAGPSSSQSQLKQSSDSFSGKSTPDIAEVEKLKEIQETLKYEQHIAGSSTPPTVPVSPSVVTSSQPPETRKAVLETAVSSIKDNEIRSCTPASDDYEIAQSTHSDISSGQVSRTPYTLDSERVVSDNEDDLPGSPLSMTSQVAGSRSSSHYDLDDEHKLPPIDPMSMSFYGALPDEPEEQDFDFNKAVSEHREVRGADLVLKEGPKSQKDDVMTASFIGELPEPASSEKSKDPIESWGKPLGLPSPAPPSDNKGTPKKERKLPPNVSAKNKLNDDKKRSESPSKQRNKKVSPVYVDLTYVPHHGNSFYAYVDFFRRVRARYYVFSGIEPSKEVYNALLEAKQTWDDKDLEVTIIPTYDTDILGYWVAENEELLTKYKIDLSPSASRCTINLQDHETSCSAYRLEF